MYYVHGNIYGNCINQYESIYINYIVLHSNIYSLLYILTPGNPKRDVCDVMLAVNNQPNFVPQIQVKSQCLQRQKYLQPWMFLDTITPPQIWGSPSIMIFLSCLSTMVINYADINMDISTVNPEADFMGLAWAWDLYLVVPVSHSTIIMSKGFSNYCSDVEPHEPLLFS